MSTVLATRDVSVERRRAATLDCRHHLKLAEAQVARPGRLIDPVHSTRWKRCIMTMSNGGESVTPAPKKYRVNRACLEEASQGLDRSRQPRVREQPRPRGDSELEVRSSAESRPDGCRPMKKGLKSKQLTLRSSLPIFQ
jgi:hypothetical protein